MPEGTENKKTQRVYNMLAAAATLIATVGVGPSLFEKIWPKNQPPAAKITATKQSGPAPLEVTFDGTKSSDPEGGELKYTWHLDNNVVSHGRSFKQQLIAPGVYVVALVVEDAKKLQHQDSLMITVYPKKENQESLPNNPAANAEQNQPPPASKKEFIAPMFVNSVDPTAMLVAHNQWRSQAGSADIAWSDKLAQDAQTLSDNLRDRGCTTSHSGNFYDENIFRAGAIVYSNGRREFKKKTPVEVTKTWSRDSKGYSNMIRKSASKIGCAMSVCEDKSQLWVCCYYPLEKSAR